jgi:serine/threonine-protein kinase/endoribonuclease IRE1
VAIFDIVKTSSRSNPLALLQPRPRLEHLLPHSPSNPSRSAHDLPEVTYVGLVGESLYAMGHTNFPLVVFDQEPPHMAIPEGDMSVSHICDGIHCMVGARKVGSASQWYLPPLLDAVPNIPGLLEERVSFDRRIHPESPNPDSDTNESRTSANDVEEGRQTYDEAQLGKWGVIGFAAMLLVALVRYFMANRQMSPSIQPTMSPKEIAVDVEKPVAESISIPTSSPPISDSPSVEVVTPPESDPITSTPKPVEPTFQLQSPLEEFAGELEDGDESEKEGPSDVPRRKGPRRRKRGKKKKAEGMGPGTEQAEDNVLAAKNALEEPPVATLTPVTPVPVPSSPSLMVSDTVLGAKQLCYGKANPDIPE